jgi:hypothetical protein
MQLLIVRADLPVSGKRAETALGVLPAPPM